MYSNPNGGSLFHAPRDGNSVAGLTSKTSKRDMIIKKHELNTKYLILADRQDLDVISDILYGIGDRFDVINALRQLDGHEGRDLVG